MGSIFGKETVKEPPYDVLLERTNGAKTSYELRKYGERFAASVSYVDDGDNNSSPFRTLAGYIGVFGNAQNEGSTKMAMTAPVVMEQDGKPEPETIAMTAPVVMENSADGKMKKMMFMLPEEYNDMSKIPKPMNPAVHIEEIPPEFGVVHRYSGKMDTEMNRGMAKELGVQLMEDGVKGITEEFVMEHFQFWGYNPPFTIPAFRRNEVWLKLNDEQVNYLKEKFPASATEGRLVGGSSSMSGRAIVGLGACGFLVGALAINVLFRSRSQYRRL